MQQQQIQAWRDAVALWNATAAQVSDDQRQNATPCDEWDVDGLMAHTHQWQTRGAAALGVDVDADADWPTTVAALDAGLGQDGALDGTATEFGNMPKHQLFGLMTMDLALHTWDLGKAVGVDVELPEALAVASLMGLQRMPEEQLRGSGTFAAAVEVGDDATPTERLVAFAGRQP